MKQYKFTDFLSVITYIMIFVLRRLVFFTYSARIHDRLLSLYRKS